MRRAAVEKLRTRNVWLSHLRRHRAGYGPDARALACVCEFQIGRFRKGQRVGGCGHARCWVCHSGKLGGDPTVEHLRCIQTYQEGLEEVLAVEEKPI